MCFRLPCNQRGWPWPALPWWTSETSPGDLPSPLHLPRRLLALQDETGYDIVQKQGQRIFGGPPPGWAGEAPGRGTEVYCYRIPRDCFEDELVPVFAAVGRIYELRLMIEFSGANRTYGYVRYCEARDAREAVRRLHNHMVRPGHPLAVALSVDNRQLTARLVPAVGRGEREVVEELAALGVEGVAGARLRGGSWLQLDFSSHRLAALARRQLVPATLRLWGQVEVRGVEWATPEDYTTSTPSRVLAVRNLPPSLAYGKTVDLFNQLSDGQVEAVVRTAAVVLVTLATSEAARLVVARSEGLELGSGRVEVAEYRTQPSRRVDRGYVLPSRGRRFRGRRMGEPLQRRWPC